MLLVILSPYVKSVDFQIPSSFLARYSPNSENESYPVMESCYSSREAKTSIFVCFFKIKTANRGFSAPYRLNL